MRKFWRELLIILRLRRRPPPLPLALLLEPGPEEPPEPDDTTPPEPKPTPPAQDKDVSDTRWSHLGDILDNLDDYFYWIKRLKHWDSDAYALYKRMGGIVVGDKGRMKIQTYEETILPTDPRQWPTIAYVSWPGNDNFKTICPRLIYFQKMDGFGDFVRVGSVFYRGVLFYADKSTVPGTDGKPCEYPLLFFVGVLDDCTVVPLKVLQVETQTIKPKHGERFIVRHKKVTYPKALKTLAEENHLTPEKMASVAFFAALNGTAGCAGGMQVNVRRDDMVARFAIQQRRSAYFFKDREFQATVNGRRRRIFHYVSAHERELADGRTTTVKQHWRGERNFTWNGYEVRISIPDLHHPAMERLTDPSRDIDDKFNEETIDMAGLGDVVKQQVWKGRT